MALFTPTEITDNYAKASIAKAESPAWRLFLLAVAAGVFIGLGAVTSSTAAHALENAGMVRLVSGLIFPIGLMMVILLGTELFTGNALMVTAAVSGKISWKLLLRNWGIVFLGNLAGAVVLAALMAFFGQLNIGGGDLAVYTAKVAAAKNGLDKRVCAGHLLQPHGVRRGVPGEHGPGHRRQAARHFLPHHGIRAGRFRALRRRHVLRARGHLRLYESGLYGHD